MFCVEPRMAFGMKHSRDAIVANRIRRSRKGVVVLRIAFKVSVPSG